MILTRVHFCGPTSGDCARSRQLLYIRAFPSSLLLQHPQSNFTYPTPQLSPQLLLPKLHCNIHTYTTIQVAPSTMAFSQRRTATLTQSYSRAIEQPTPVVSQKKTGKVDRGIQYRRDLIKRLARYPTPPPAFEEPAQIQYHDDHEEDFSGSVQVSESPLLRFSSMDTISDDIPLIEPVIEAKPQRKTGKEFTDIDYQRELLRKLSRVATPRKQKLAYESDIAQHSSQQMSVSSEDHITPQHTVENIAPEERMELEPVVQNVQEQPYTTSENFTTTFEDFITTAEDFVTSSENITTTEEFVATPKALITPSENITTSEEFIATPNPLPVINTAVLTTAAEDIRHIQLQAGIEDTTFDEFESILEDAQPSSAEANENADTDDTLAFLTYDDMGRPLSKDERERRLDELFLQRMSDRLTKTSSNIRQAKQGIERLEREVSSPSTPTPATAAIPESTSPVEPDLYIKIRVPRLWTHTGSATPAKGRNVYFVRNWKFTWCGLILFLFLIWFITETAVCSAYCKPEYASEAIWSYNDPSFPYALPTKLDHLTGKSISTAIDGVSSYFGNIISPSRPVRRSRSSAPATVTWEDRIGKFEDDELVWE